MSGWRQPAQLSHDERSERDFVQIKAFPQPQLTRRNQVLIVPKKTKLLTLSGLKTASFSGPPPVHQALSSCYLVQNSVQSPVGIIA